MWCCRLGLSGKADVILVMNNKSKTSVQGNIKGRKFTQKK